MEEKYTIEAFEWEKESIWDEFVEKNSVNGTFLHTRRFLNYHLENRFEDASFFIWNSKGRIVAVVPGCVQYESEAKVFYSHKGSAYGGPIVSHEVYTLKRMVEIIDLIQKYLKTHGFEKIIYKITPNLFSLMPVELLEYTLYYRGYVEEKELNLYVEYDEYKDNTLSNFSKGKKYNVKQCMREGLKLKELVSENDIRELYRILEITLDKYSLKPIHTEEELIKLKEICIPKECGFFGLFLDDKLVSGSMVFYFNNVSVAHTQYLCSLPEYNTISPMTYMYFCMIEEMKKKGFRKLSWGISTEHGGRVINWGLTQNKESYGSRHSINRVFSKNI